MNKKFIVDQKVYEKNVKKTIKELNDIKTYFKNKKLDTFKDAIKAIDIAIQNVKAMKDIDDCIRDWINDTINDNKQIHQINTIANEIRDENNLY